MLQDAKIKRYCIEAKIIRMNHLTLETILEHWGIPINWRTLASTEEKWKIPTPYFWRNIFKLNFSKGISLGSVDILSVLII